MAARLSDEQLAKELGGDRSALEAEAWRALEEEARRRSSPKRELILTTTPTLDQPVRLAGTAVQLDRERPDA